LNLEPNLLWDAAALAEGLIVAKKDKSAIYLLLVNKIRCEDNLQAILQKHC